MKHRTVLMALTLFWLIPSPAVAAQQQQKQSPPSIEARWLATILKVTRPDSVTIQKFKEVEIPPPDERNESPGENQKWLVLSVELKALPKSVIETEQINIVDEESAAYPAMGRDCCGSDIFVLFAKMPAGLAVGRGLGEVIVFGRSPYTPKTTLTTKSGRPSEVSFLFRIPIATERLFLQIGNGVKVPVPLQ